MFGLRLPRAPVLLIIGALLLAGAVAAALLFLRPHVTLRLTTGMPGIGSQRLVNAFLKVSAAEHPRAHFEVVQAADLTASAKALEDGKTDLAVVRSDVTPPTNGQTIAILRRDVVALVLAPNSSIDKFAGLDGKTIAIPEGPLQGYNTSAFDSILSYYNIPAKAVKRVVLPIADIGQAVHDKHVAAVLAIGPMGPGEVVDVVAAIAKATKGSPGILAFDEADAINARFPAFESIDVPAGAFRGKPPTPDDTVTTLAITYRLVASQTMLALTAGAIGQTLFTNKAKLLAETPAAAGIEAPDPDDKNPLLPVHPGVAAYLNNGEQSFLDEFQQYFYLGGMLLSVLGSAIALLAGHRHRKKSDAEATRISRLLEIAEQSYDAKGPALDAMEKDLNAIVAWFVNLQTTNAIDPNIFSVAVNHARHTIDRRRAALQPGPAGPA